MPPLSDLLGHPIHLLGRWLINGVGGVQKALQAGSETRHLPGQEPVQDVVALTAAFEQARVR
jgi:hypothetical protein